MARINEQDLRTDKTMEAVKLLKETPCAHHPRDSIVFDCAECMAEILEGYKAGTWPPSVPPTLPEMIAQALAAAPRCEEGRHDRSVQPRGDCSDCQQQGTTDGALTTTEIIEKVLTEEGIEE